MLLPEGTARAAQRWLQLLSRSSFDQAAALISADPTYADLTQTQYAAAIDWLRSSSLVAVTGHGVVLSGAAAGVRGEDLGPVLFGAVLDQGRPPWLADADILVEGEELPGDAAALADVLGLPIGEALLTVRQIHGKIDLAERARVGAAGERALMEVLDSAWPGSARHVALDHDGFGYDIELQCGSAIWHIEVKSTTRRSRLAVFLSRHEYEISILDPAWRLVAIGLNEHNQIDAVATASAATVVNRAPRDRHVAGRWDSVRLLLGHSDLDPGLPFLDADFMLAAPRILLPSPIVSRFDWMPRV